MLSTTRKSQEVEVSQRIQETNCGDRISALADDLLVHILLFVPTKDVVATMLLSKRWRNMWKVVPRLKYEDKNKTSANESVWWFLDKSLQLHKATILECLCIKLGQRCPIDADVTKWVANAVDRWVRKLVFDLRWSAEPTSMPKSLYTCETLIKLELSNKVLVDVPSSVFLPSLKKLYLSRVVYQDELSIVRLLSSCPVLRNLHVFRCKNDGNVKEYCVKVPSLTDLSYVNGSLHGNDVADDIGRLVVIDCPALKNLYTFDYSRDSCSIGNMPHIDRAVVTFFCYLDKKFLRYLSSATTLSLTLTQGLIMSCTPDNFSQIVHLSISPWDSNWLEPLMLMLKTNPKIKSLQISYFYENTPFLWNKPDCVPECLTLHLEFFSWYSYKGRKDENEFVAYILANSKCLKKAEFFLNCKDREETRKVTQEVKSMFKASPSCRLRF